MKLSPTEVSLILVKVKTSHPGYSVEESFVAVVEELTAQTVDEDGPLGEVWATAFEAGKVAGYDEGYEAGFSDGADSVEG